ncbi:hypothetical protein [Acidipropionibacterium timonense]|uniref:hypothetical protein n=1 Tax=Acidipropionibacterium timonense TaxID=2161818 RepID=UPI00103076F4|nr:hypothetical protein [Acidipropionibacterium timonense]
MSALSTLTLLPLKVAPITPTMPPGMEKFHQFLNWGAGIVTILCVLGVILVAGRMAIQHHRGQGEEAAGGLGWVMFACVLVGAAVQLVNWMIG